MPKKYSIAEAARQLGITGAAVDSHAGADCFGDRPMTFLSDVWCGCKWTLVAGCILLAAVLAGWYVGLLLWPSAPATQAKCLDSIMVCRRLY